MILIPVEVLAVIVATVAVPPFLWNLQLRNWSEIWRQSEAKL